MSRTRTASHGKRAGRQPAVPRMLVFLPLVTLYFELLLKIFGDTGITFRSLVYIVFFSLSAGVLLYLLCSLASSRKVNRRIVLILLIVLPVYFLIQFFLKQTFGFYYSLADIFSNTKQIAGSYSGSIFLIVASGWYMLPLYALPLILYALVGRYFVPADGAHAKQRVVAVAAFLFTFLIAFLGVFTGRTGLVTDKGYYRSHYQADDATIRFGLLTSLRLDIQYSIFGVPEESDGDTGSDEGEIIWPTSSGDPSSRPPVSSDPVSSQDDPPVPAGDNILSGLDLTALAAGEKDKTVKDMHNYFAGLTPTEKNRYTGMFQGKNLIFVVAEAFSPYVVDEQRTPTLYRLANTGVVCSDYYQPCWGQSTSGGEYSALLGQIPTRKNEKESGLSMYLGRKNNWYYSMGNVLGRQGYLTLAFHNNTYDYYDRDETHDNLGYQYYGKIGGVMARTFSGNYYNRYDGIIAETVSGHTASIEGTVSNGIDRDMIDSTLPLFINKEPFHVYYLTMSGHNNYSMSNSKAKRNASFVQGLHYSDTVKAYLAYQQELEFAMQSLVEQLEAAGKAENTVICLTADHYPYGLDNGAFGNDRDYTGELMGKSSYTVAERDKSTLILWCKGMQPIYVDKPCSSVDILPTLLNLFGVEYDSRLLPGRDMLSSAEGLVVFADYSWKASGGYRSANGSFTPSANAGFADAAAAKAYRDATNKVALAQVEYSRLIRQKDYYRILFGNK